MLDKIYSRTKAIKGCLIWQGAKDGKGYGFIRYKGKLWKTHRLTYFLHYSEYPDKFQVCHTCDTPSCVQPFHLFLGTNFENSIDMLKKKRFYNQKKTHCPKGHPYSGDNLITLKTNSGLQRERRCKECFNAERRRRYRRKYGS